MLKAWLRELLVPVRDTPLLLAICGLWLLVSIALMAGPFGLWLLIVAVPAGIGYFTLVLEAYAQGRTAPVLAIEQFNLAYEPWRWFPVLWVLPVAFAEMVWLQEHAGWLLIVLVLQSLWFPAFLALLAMTHSPLASFDLRRAFSLVRELGPAYLGWPLTLLLCQVAWVELGSRSLPNFLLVFAVIYTAALGCTYGGRLIARLDIAAETDIPPAREVSLAKTEADELASRHAALERAYAFASRGNQQGAFAHLDAHAADEHAPLDLRLWFFHEMLKWDLGNTPLFYARTLIGDLLDAGRTPAALKLVLRCLAENADFRPDPDDLPRLRAAAEASGNDAVLSALRL